MDKLKVAIIIDQTGGGGGAVFVKKIRDYLLKQGEEVEVLAREEELSTIRIPFSESDGIFRLIGIPRASGHIKKELSRVNPDVVLILSPVAAIATMSAIPKESDFKTIYAPRYLALEHWEMIESGIKGKIKRIIEERALNFNYDKIFALNENMKERMLEAGAKSPIERVPIGVDTKKFFPRRKKTRELVLLFVGRFEPVKGINIFIEASKRFEGAKFVMVGDKKEKLGEVPPSVNVKEKVPHSEMVNLYNWAYALVMPSYSEGLPRACLEALACGTPVIASKVGGVPELVLDGKTGFLIEPGNVDQLVERIEELLENPKLAEEMGRKGRAHVVKNYDDAKIMNKTIQALRRITGEQT